MLKAGGIVILMAAIRKSNGLSLPENGITLILTDMQSKINGDALKGCGTTLMINARWFVDF